MQLHQRRVCKPLIDFAKTGKVSNWTVWAIQAVGHEAAHVRGVRVERVAECSGTRFAYSYMKRKGVFKTYVEAGIRKDLLDDSHRPAEYKLRGTCSI